MPGILIMASTALVLEFYLQQTRCPFCPYNPMHNGHELKKGVAAVLRKHIETKHCGQFQYWGLYVVSQEESVTWFDYQEPAAVGSEDETDEEEEILREIETLLHRQREVKRRR